MKMIQKNNKQTRKSKRRKSKQIRNKQMRTKQRKKQTRKKNLDKSMKNMRGGSGESTLEEEEEDEGGAVSRQAWEAAKQKVVARIPEIKAMQLRRAAEFEKKHQAAWNAGDGRSRAPSSRHGPGRKIGPTRLPPHAASVGLAERAAEESGIGGAVTDMGGESTPRTVIDSPRTVINSPRNISDSPSERGSGEETDEEEEMGYPESSMFDVVTGSTMNANEAIFRPRAHASRLEGVTIKGHPDKNYNGIYIENGEEGGLPIFQKETFHLFYNKKSNKKSNGWFLNDSAATENDGNGCWIHEPSGILPVGTQLWRVKESNSNEWSDLNLTLELNYLDEILGNWSEIEMFLRNENETLIKDNERLEHELSRSQRAFRFLSEAEEKQAGEKETLKKDNKILEYELLRSQKAFRVLSKSI